MNSQDIINSTADIIGSTIGGAIGLVGGPKGAIIGSMAGPAITNALKDFVHRQLSSREQLRVANSATYIADGILEKQRAGEIVRQDDFFEGDNNFTNNGAELLEGILMKCKEQYQERKVFFISNIFKNVAFDATITARAAHQTLSLAEELTYQKLCLLAYYGNRKAFENFNIMNDPGVWYPDVIFPAEMEICLQDLLELTNQGVLLSSVLANDSESMMPGEMTLTAKGQRAFDLMELKSVASADVLEAMQPLEFQQCWGVNTNGVANGGLPKRES